MSEKKMPEFHLIISWEKSNLSSEDIISRFPTSLKLLNHFKYTWNPKFANRNFAAFYGQKLDNIDYKVNHCGSGSFDIYLIKDLSPVYEIRHTTSGDNNVNIHLFDLKKKLRELSGGGHLVHGTDSPRECNLNIASLFGTTVERIVDLYKNRCDEIIPISRNISGVPFWNSWEELFSLLNICTDYVVLRNSKTVLESDHALHGDTDILVRDRTAADVVLAANKIHGDKRRVMYETQFPNGPQLLDVRYVGDGYYSEKWEHEILEQRVCIRNEWLYIPDEENFKYSLLYHALVHKPEIADDYRDTITAYFGTLDKQVLTDRLKQYLNEKNYGFPTPIDPSVYINPYFYKEISVPFTKRIQYTLRKYMNESDSSNRKRRDKAIYKILYKGRRMARKPLGKIKKVIKKAKSLIRKAI